MSLLDVVIIGAGPAGLAASIECSEKDLSHRVIEKGSIVESLRRFPTNMVYFTTPDLLEIGDLPLVTSHEKPSRLEALKYYRRVADRYRLPLNLYEKVEEVGRQNGLFRVRTTLQARKTGVGMWRSSEAKSCRSLMPRAERRAHRRPFHAVVRPHSL